jgi:Transposase DDE domain
LSFIFKPERFFMATSLSEKGGDSHIGFSAFDQLSYSDRSLPFSHVLSADRIRERFADSDVLFGTGEEDHWDTGLTLWSFVGQTLLDGKQRSCNAAVTHATRYMIEHGLQPPGPDSGDYCRARHKLDAHVLRQLVSDMAETLSSSNPNHWLWQGREVKLVDGFTFTMPDTPENQEAFPQLTSQTPGVGFPIARACAVLSLANACIYDAAIGPYAGKETGETALLRKILDCFKPGDIMLADRYFCSYFMMAILKSRGVDVCMRLHQLRPVNASDVKWLGKNEYVETWHRPQKAKWMSQELYDSLPETMDLRVLAFNTRIGKESEPLYVATTLLDHETYRSNAIGQLYGFRWHGELDIRSIKQLLNLEHLRCKTPEMIHREIWTTLLAYNMVRLVCAQAAAVHDKLPRQMSFTIASNTLLSQWLMPPDESIRKKLGEYNLWQIACNEVGNRPGRIEPRVLKRRPKPYSLMTQPRNKYKQAQA